MDPRFVEFSTVREAETAIQLFHNKDMGRGVSLIVKVSDSKKNRDQRLKKDMEDNKFLDTLNCARNGSKDANHPEWSSIEDTKMVDNPLQPRYVSSMGSNTTAATPSSSSAQLPRERAKSSVPATSPNGAEGGSLDKTVWPCVVCGTLTASRCSNCRTVYCNIQCQRQDWPQHKRVCRARSSTTRSSPQQQRPTAPADAFPSTRAVDTEPLRIAEHSDDDGFVVDCHGKENLVAVKAMIEHVKDGNDLSGVEVYDDTDTPPRGREVLRDTPAAKLPAKTPTGASPSVANTSLADTNTTFTPIQSVPSRLNLSLGLSTETPQGIENLTSSKSLPATPFTSMAKTTPSSDLPRAPLPTRGSCMGPFAANSTFQQPPNTTMSLPVGIVPQKDLFPSMSLPAGIVPQDQFPPCDEIPVPLSLICSQYDVVPRPLPSLDLTSPPPLEFIGIVTCYHSTQLTVVAASVETKQAIQQVVRSGKNFQPGKIAATYLSKGSKCGHMSTDGSFVRVCVEKVLSPDTVLIRRYDFGGFLAVKVTELCYLTEDMVLLPSLAIQCSLKDVFLSDSGKTNLAGVSSVLQELVSGMPVLVKNHGGGESHSPLLCTVHSDINGVDLSAALLKSPFVSSSGSTSREIKSPSSLKLVRLSSSVPFHAIVADTVIEILPTVVTNPGIIWGQVMHSQLGMMDQMHKHMNECYPPPNTAVSFPYVPVVGEICVAKNLHDQQYYRAEVLCVNHSGMVDIRFVETGMGDTVTTSQLHHVQPVFLTLPKQARRFSMSGVSPSQSLHWSGNAVAFLREKILNRRVAVKVLSLSHSECVVDIFDPDLTNQLLNNSLILLGHAEVPQANQREASSSTPLTGVTVGKRSTSAEESSCHGQLSAEGLPETREDVVSSFVGDDGIPPSKVCPVATPSSPASAPRSKGGSGSTSCVDNDGLPPSKVCPVATPSSPASAPRSERGSGKVSFTSRVDDDDLPPSKVCPVTMPSSPASVPQSEGSSMKTGDSDYSVMCLPTGEDYVDVSLSHMQNPNRFYCQLVTPENMSKVQPVLHRLEKLSQGSLAPLSNKALGKGCLCVYPEDNHSIHRAKIIKCDRDLLRVAFVDYGNTYSTNLSNVYKIPPEFLQLPAQALMCSLNQCLNPAGKSSDWDPAAKKFAMSVTQDSSSVKMKVVKVVGQLHVVDMLVSTSEGEQDLLELIVKGGLCHKFNNELSPEGQVVKKSSKKTDGNRSPTKTLTKTSSWSGKSAGSKGDKITSLSPRSGSKSQDRGIITTPSQVGVTAPLAGDVIPPSPGKQCPTKVHALGKKDSFSSLENIQTSQSHPLVKDLDRNALPDAESFMVLVSEVVSAEEMYVQVATPQVGALLKQISEGINSQFQTLPPQPLSSPPGVGCLCCARFSLDNSWYRVEVVAVEGGSCVVFFVDYGNKETVPLTSMAVCPPEFASLPLITVKCALNGVPSGPPRQKEISQFLKQHTADVILSARVSQNISGVPHVKLFAGETDLLEEMQSMGIVQAIQTHPLVKDLERNTFPDADSFMVLVSEVVSAEEMYVQVATPQVGALLKQISEGINSQFQTSPPQPLSSPPGVGCLCCARFSLDNSWYRVEVVAVEGGSCVVFFVDYGNKETVPLTSMAVCPPEFASLPLITVKCALNGVPSGSPKQQEISQFLKQHTADVILSARVSQNISGVPHVKLFAGETGLLEEMKSMGIVQAIQTHPLVKNLERSTFPDADSFKVLVSEVVSAEEMYVQVATPQVGALLKQISEGINSQFQTSPPQPLSSPPGVGCLCCARFSLDNSWYRVEVVAVEGGSCVVFFVDYGNKETVPLTSMAVCPPEFASLPLITVKCALNGVPSGSPKQQEISQFLKQHTADVILSARVSQNISGVPHVKLFAGETGLLEEMKSMGIVQAIQTHPLVKNLERSTFPDADSFKVLVSEVVSAGEMYVQVATPQVGALLKQISEGINSQFQTSPPQPLSSPPGVGCLCCARFSLDNSWYRVEVVAVEGGSCVVFFVDYGNKETVPLTSMAVCPPEFASLPLITVKCALNGIPSKELSSKAVVSFLRQEALEHLLTARSVGKAPEHVTQLDFRDGEKSLLDRMVQQGVITLPCQQQPLPLVADLEVVCLPEPPSVFQAMVTEVVSADEFYIQLATQEVGALLYRVSDELNAHLDSSTPAPLSSLPPVGSLCCARFSQDSQWYRVQVLAVKSDVDIAVLFLDYGNTEQVALSTLAVCPSQFATCRIVAVKCGLGGLTPSTIVSVDQVTKFLKQKAVNILLSAQVLGKVGGASLLELKDAQGTSLVAAMIKLGYVAEPLPLASDLKILEFPRASKDVKVMVFEVVSLSRFYLHAHMNETATVMDKITNAINSSLTTPPEPLSALPEVGTVCLAKYGEDDTWCRVKIVAVKTNRCRVFFLDYGNTCAVSLSEVAACPPDVASFPRVAIECGLSGVPAEKVGDTKLISALKGLTDSVVLSATFVSELGGVPQVQLTSGTTSLLSELGLLQEVEVSPFPMVDNMKKHTLPETGDPFRLMVFEVMGPQELYVQVDDEKLIANLISVTQGLSSSFQSGPHVPLSAPPPLGSLCCAKFSQDATWYRVRVSAVVGGKCKVFFVDYGNSEEVELKDMALCPAELCDLPLVAVRCALYGMDDFIWSSQALDILKDLTCNRLLEASIVDSNHGYPSIQLVDKSDGTLISAKFSQLYTSTVSLQKCQVTEVNHPGSFYLQYVEKENAPWFSLLQKLQNVYANPTTYEDFTPLVGSLCCSQYSEDKFWYRCKILSISKQVVSLSYIDFGSVCKVVRSKVYRLDEEFAGFPPLAVHCKLDGIGPAGASGWTEQSTASFRSLCSKCDGGVVFARSALGGEVTGVKVVHLYLDAAGNTSVVDTLLSSGFGVRA